MHLGLHVPFVNTRVELQVTHDVLKLEVHVKHEKWHCRHEEVIVSPYVPGGQLPRQLDPDKNRGVEQLVQLLPFKTQVLHFVSQL